MCDYVACAKFRSRFNAKDTKSRRRSGPQSCDKAFSMAQSVFRGENNYWFCACGEWRMCCRRSRRDETCHCFCLWLQWDTYIKYAPAISAAAAAAAARRFFAARKTLRNAGNTYCIDAAEALAHLQLKQYFLRRMLKACALLCDVKVLAPYLQEIWSWTLLK